jgi:hypothetical protein
LATHQTRFMATVALTMLIPLHALRADDWAQNARTIYTRELLELDQSLSQNLAPWRTNYKTALEKLMKERQAAADTAGALAARDELNRFREEKDIPERDAPSTATAVTHIRELFRSEIDRLNYQHARRVLQLTDKYVNHLATRQRDLTRDGKLDAASDLTTQMSGAREHGRVTAAQFAVDDYDARQKQPADRDTDAVDVAGSRPAATPPRDLPDAIPLAKDPRFQVYADGSPPASLRTHYRRINLHPTPHVGLRSQVSAYLYLSSDTSRDNTKKDRVRLELRAKKAGQAVQRPWVYVQYFSKDTHVRSGKIIPHPFRTERLQLQSLGSAITTVDFPETPEVRTTSYRRRGYSPSYSSYEFYGVVVSAFTQEGELTCQGASTTTLRDHAIPSKKALDAKLTRRF